MINTYPVHHAAELRQHLRSLRKKHGLSQAQTGALVGVSQARIAEIEASPGLVSFDQIIQLLSALDATVHINESQKAPDEPGLSTKNPFAPGSHVSKRGIW